MRRVSFAWVVVAVVGVFLGCFLLWPLAETFRGALFDLEGRPTLAYLKVLLENPTYVEGFVNALGVAFASTALASVFGISVALALDRWAFPGKRWLAKLVPLPLVVPPFVGAIGIKQLLGQAGALNAFLIELGVMGADHPINWLQHGRFWVVVCLTALHLYPVLYFNVSAALSAVNPEMEEAAENLGASGLGKLRRVTLPLVMPSVFAAVTIVFIWSLTELGVPLLCDYTRITSVQIYAGLKDIHRDPFVYALVVVVLFVTIALYALAKLAFGRTSFALATKGTRARVPRRLPVSRGLMVTGLVSLLVLLAGLPNVSVVLVAFSGDWYRTVIPTSFTLAHFQAALGNGWVVPSIANSLRYVTFATLLDIVLGVAIAYVLVRRRSRAALLLDAAAMLPLAIPGLVMAFGYLAISREGRPFAWLNPARDPTALLVIAYGVRRLPFVVRSAAAGLQQISVVLEEAASNLGAGPWRTFGRVTAPLLAPHLLAGGVFAFALSMLEVSDSLILAQKQSTFPVTKAIYELFMLLGDGRWLAAALGVWAMAFLAFAIAFASSMLGRRLGGLFKV